jgi:hypothetical protein
MGHIRMSQFSVYKIWSEKGDLVYYGSTANKRGAIQRWYGHKDGRDVCSSRHLFNAYGIEHCKFEILEECNSVTHMKERENWYIQNRPCVNIMSACYNPETKKNYILAHKEDKKKYDQNRRKTDDTRHNKIVCECGGTYTLRHKSTHEKTAKHLAIILS